MRMPVSHSRLEDFETCPRRFHARHVRKLKEPKSLPLMFGGFFHEWAQHYVDHLCEIKEASDYTEGRAIFEKLWAYRGLRDYVGLPESVFDGLLGVVEAFMEHHAFEPAQIVGTEIEICLTEAWEACDWMDPAAFFRAKLDLVMNYPEDPPGTQVLAVHDYKTSFAVDSETEVSESPQLRRYVMALGAIFPAPAGRDFVFEIAMDFVRPNLVRKVRLDRAAGNRERARVLAISDRIEQAAKSGAWPATPGPACAYCAVFDDCPARAVATSYRAPKAESDAKAILGRLVILDRETRDLKEKLKVWGDEHGPVTENGMSYGPTLRRSIVYDATAVLLWATRHDIKPGTVLSAADSDIRRALAKLPAQARQEAERELLAHRRDKSTTEYRLKKE